MLWLAGVDDPAERRWQQHVAAVKLCDVTLGAAGHAAVALGRQGAKPRQVPECVDDVPLQGVDCSGGLQQVHRGVGAVFGGGPREQERRQHRHDLAHPINKNPSINYSRYSMKG